MHDASHRGGLLQETSYVSWRVFGHTARRWTLQKRHRNIIHRKFSSDRETKQCKLKYKQDDETMMTMMIIIGA